MSDNLNIVGVSERALCGSSTLGGDGEGAVDVVAFPGMHMELIVDSINHLLLHGFNGIVIQELSQCIIGSLWSSDSGLGPSAFLCWRGHWGP